MGKIYTLEDINREKLFPWALRRREVRKTILADRRVENIIDAQITGEGRARRWRIEEENLKKFLDKYGPGLLLAYKIRKWNKEIL